MAQTLSSKKIAGKAKRPRFTWWRVFERIGVIFTLIFVMLPIVWLMLTALKLKKMPIL